MFLFLLKQFSAGVQLVDRRINSLSNGRARTASSIVTTATILVDVVVSVESGVDARLVFRKKAAVATDAVEVIITGGPIVGIPIIVVVRRRILANTPAGLVQEQEIQKKETETKQI